MWLEICRAAICLEPLLAEGDEAVHEELGYLTCPMARHVFHLYCLTRWSEVATTCPRDRAAFSKIYVIERLDGPTIRTIEVGSKRQGVAEHLQNEALDIIEISDEDVVEEEYTECRICGRTDGEDTMLEDETSQARPQASGNSAGQSLTRSRRNPLILDAAEQASPPRSSSRNRSTSAQNNRRTNASGAAGSRRTRVPSQGQSRSSSSSRRGTLRSGGRSRRFRSDTAINIWRELSRIRRERRSLLSGGFIDYGDYGSYSDAAAYGMNSRQHGSSSTSNGAAVGNSRRLQRTAINNFVDMRGSDPVLIVPSQSPSSVSPSPSKGGSSSGRFPNKRSFDSMSASSSSARNPENQLEQQIWRQFQSAIRHPSKSSASSSSAGPSSSARPLIGEALIDTTALRDVGSERQAKKMRTAHSVLDLDSLTGAMQSTQDMAEGVLTSTRKPSSSSTLLSSATSSSYVKPRSIPSVASAASSTESFRLGHGLSPSSDDSDSERIRSTSSKGKAPATRSADYVMASTGTPDNGLHPSPRLVPFLRSKDLPRVKVKKHDNAVPAPVATTTSTENVVDIKGKGRAVGPPTSAGSSSNWDQSNSSRPYTKYPKSSLEGTMRETATTNTTNTTTKIVTSTPGGRTKRNASASVSSSARNSGSDSTPESSPRNHSTKPPSSSSSSALSLSTSAPSKSSHLYTKVEILGFVKKVLKTKNIDRETFKEVARSVVHELLDYMSSHGEGRGSERWDDEWISVTAERKVEAHLKQLRNHV
ncbi:hypothetical protein HK102_008195 [Quaeritorhiza haematococci]|nr:hypothetical protein HK102_008195 [Quaeritorhiza haematococci]